MQTPSADSRDAVAEPHSSMSSPAAEGLPVLSKKKAKKAKKVTQKIKVVPGSVDAMVQHTNDDSVVSKRSAVTHQYMTDPFLRHFVKKPSRRSPLINRGYYLRMKVIDDTITELIRFFTTRGDAPVQVISLGAGFDTFALRALLSPGAGMPNTDGVYFYDVDFPAVMQNKAALMRAAPPATFPERMTLQPEQATHTVSSRHYNAVGVDLREASTTLIPLLTAASTASGAAFSTANPTIIYAECVMQYMPAEDAQQLVHFIAEHFADAVFVAYDQIHPDDSFGHVMQQSLRQKSSPLLGIEARPDGRALTQSAVQHGMACALFANFYDLSRVIISGEERARVNALEPFDELEEWAEMCEHYGITVATTRPDTAQCVQGNPAFKPVPPLPSGDASAIVPVSAHTWPTGRFALEGWGNGGACVEPLSATAACSAEDALIVSFGGFVVGRSHERVNTVFVHSLREGELSVVPVVGRAPAATSAAPPALCFHTLTRIAPCRYVVFGGRTNPTDVHGEAYLLHLQLPSTSIELGCHVSAVWTRLQSAVAGPSPRYRHMACAVGPNTLLLFGGKTADGALLNDCWRAVVNIEAATIDWRPVPLGTASGAVSGGLATTPPPMCSAALTFSPQNGLAYLSGGLMEGELCSSSVYTLEPTTGRCEAMPGVDMGARFSHAASLVTVDGAEALFLLGGSTCTEKARLSPGVVLRLADGRVSPVQVPTNMPWWSRHSCLTLANGTVAVVAGGYTCFSFGTFTARPTVLRLGSDCAPWPLPTKAWKTASATTATASSAAADTPPTQPPPGDFSCPTQTLYTANAPELSYARLLCLPRPPIEARPYTADGFVAAATAASRPVVFRGASLGRCVERWASPAYLKEAEGAATVSVHVAQDSTVLDFVRKNFVHRHVSLAELVDHVVDATATYMASGALPRETWYYRSIAAHMKSDRANLWTDFPKLGDDFVLPPGAAEHVMPRLHQCCLRINAAPLQLWTHYDTQDNVLCQIVGRKRVVMFPPHCHNDLYMTGSSSPVLNLDAPDLLKYPRFVEACKHATEIILEPGDMLYFPANWFHHITTLPDAREAGHTVSVNAFFRRFEVSEYDPKDLYGNKDLPVCAELREKLVNYAQTLMRETHLRSSTPDGTTVPAEYARFAVRQAIQDLERLLAADALAAAAQSSVN